MYLALASVTAPISFSDSASKIWSVGSFCPAITQTRRSAKTLVQTAVGTPSVAIVILGLNLPPSTSSTR